jgi:hypothetical protein
MGTFFQQSVAKTDSLFLSEKCTFCHKVTALRSKVAGLRSYYEAGQSTLGPSATPLDIDSVSPAADTLRGEEKNGA